MLVDVQNQIIENECMLDQGYPLICLLSTEMVNALHSALPNIPNTVIGHIVEFAASDEIFSHLNLWLRLSGSGAIQDPIAVSPRSNPFCVEPNSLNDIIDKMSQSDPN